MKAILTVAPSAAGKTRWAEKFVRENPGWCNINRDDIRFDHILDGVRDWSRYKFNKTNEQKVSEIQDRMIKEAHERGLNIIISDTNLTAKYRNEMIQKLEGLGYEVEIKDDFDVDLDTLFKRDQLRANGVGYSVIRRQWVQWLEYKGRKRYVPNGELPNAIIVDCDGTVADMKGVRGPFEWDKVHLDNPIMVMIELVQAMADRGFAIVFLSGRDGSCYQATKEWLEHVFNGSLGDIELYTRKAGDRRKDAVIKEEIFWEHLADKYNICLAIDDRPIMVRLWNDLGIKTLACADPYIEF